MPRFILPLLLAASGMVSESNGATYAVATAAEFNALPALNAGDLVVLQGGSYGALNKTLVSTIADDATAQANPILVYAEVPGAVDVTAPSQITLQGRGIILAGIDFIAGSGMRDNGSTNPAWIIATAADSRLMKISNVRFLNCTAGDTYGHWIYCEGFHHTIEYCSFQGKDAPNANATVAFKRNTSEAGIATPREHLLRGCYFGPRECSSTDNGYETIRIGDSSSQAHDMRVTIEGNVFYRSIWRTDGAKANDTEIISNKTKGNRILHNTFLESFGQITLRHGDACLVEGNFIFGGGTYSGSSIVLNAANSYQGGIRIIGQDHVVRNNYLVNLAGTELRAALCLMAGATSWTDGNGSGGNNGYETASNAQIAHNTFLNCREMNLGFVDTGALQPTGVMIYNNAWQGSGTSNGVVRNSAFTPAGSGGNYLYHSSSGSLGWTGLGGTYSSTVSPGISEDFDQYKIPSASSPLLGAADLTLAASEDVRGLSRPVAGRDVGCFEREVAGSGLRPLFRNEVGPVFDGGPAGTYPAPGDTAPVITTTSLPVGTVGVAYQQTLTAAAGEGTLAWSLVSGTLPTGIELSAAGVLSGMPTTAGTSTFTVKVADGDGDEDTQMLSLTINATPGDTSPVITTTSLPAGTVGVAYQQTLTAVEGDGTLAWLLISGTLPAGVELSAAGVLSGMPTTAGASTFTVKVADTDGDEDTQALSITINATGGGSAAKFTVAAANVTASTDDGNVPANTIDGSLVTRWSAQGDGQWIRYDLGAVKNVHFLQIAWYNGASRTAAFHVEGSNDDATWTAITTGTLQSSGTTTALETVELPDTLVRFVRIVGHGHSSTSGSGLWNSITETEIWGTTASPPLVPTNLTPTADNGQVTLTWTASSGATLHTLKRSITSSGGFTTIASTAGGSFLDTAVVNGTTYYYAVSAGNAAGESADSPLASAKPYAPITPAELVAPIASMSGQDVELTIQSVPGRVYQLQRTDTLAPADWMNIGAPQIGTGAQMLFSDPDAILVPSRFYRLLIQP